MGLEHAKMIYWLYSFSKVKGNYKKIKGVERVLKFKIWLQVEYTMIIIIAWLLIIGAVFLFFIALIHEIVNLFI